MVTKVRAGKNLTHVKERSTYQHQTVHAHVNYNSHMGKPVSGWSRYPSLLIRGSMPLCLEAVLGLQEVPPSWEGRLPPTPSLIHTAHSVLPKSKDSQLRHEKFLKIHDLPYSEFIAVALRF